MEPGEAPGKSSEASKVSIITPSLNQGKFLRENIESILSQSYRNIEHVVADGVSTDETLDILKEYPHIKWSSEKEDGDNGLLDGIWKAFHMSGGDYVALSCVSDGLVDRNWIRKAVEILDRDQEVSHVWGLHLLISEEGEPKDLAHSDFFRHPPPQKKDFLPFWLATGEGIEQNGVFRRHIFEEFYPKNIVGEVYRFLPTLRFNYHLNTQGYLPYFLPVISYYGRIHKDQLQEKHEELYRLPSKRYFDDLAVYKENLLSGKVRHFFRDGNSRIIDEARREDISEYKKMIRRQRLKSSLQRKFQRILNRI